MQKASVNEVFKNIYPLTSVSLTLFEGIPPNLMNLKCYTISTLSYRLCFSIIFSNDFLFGPSPPIIK